MATVKSRAVCTPEPKHLEMTLFAFMLTYLDGASLIVHVGSRW